MAFYILWNSITKEAIRKVYESEGLLTETKILDEGLIRTGIWNMADTIHCSVQVAAKAQQRRLETFRYVDQTSSAEQRKVF